MKNYYFLLLLLLFAACEEEARIFKLDLPELAFSYAYINCYPYDSFVINSDSAYQTFQEENKDVFCTEDYFPKINFTEKTLLGVVKGDTGCNIALQYWNIYIDKTAKKYVFQTILESEGDCMILDRVRFWITVPKLPDDYTVEFVEYEY